MIEVAEHLGLVHHVVRSLHVPTYLHDEAYSEGLVLLCRAAVNYDPKRGTPPGAFLAQRLRWGLKSWMRQEIRHAGSELIDTPISHEEAIEARRELDRVIFVAARQLNAPEYLALLGAVYGVRQDELQAILNKTAQQLEVLRLSARHKLREEMRLL